MTDEELIAATAIRQVDGCGLTIDGQTGFCDHPKADQDYGSCHCKAMANAALTALREAGYEIVKREAIAQALTDEAQAMGLYETKPKGPA